jgi:hypothetical protein
MGAEDSNLYSNLKWAAEVKLSLEQGLESTLQELDSQSRGIERLPGSGIPGDLKTELAETLSQLKQRLNQDDFYQHQADLSITLSDIKTLVADAANKMTQDVEQSLIDAQEELPRSPGWEEITVDERNNLLGQLEQFGGKVEQSLSGIHELLNRDYEVTSTLRSLQKSVKETAEQRRLQREKEKKDRLLQEKAAGTYKPTLYQRKLPVPNRINSVAGIESLIINLQQFKQEQDDYDEIEIIFELSDKSLDSDNNESG